METSGIYRTECSENNKTRTTLAWWIEKINEHKGDVYSIKEKKNNKNSPNLKHQHKL